MNKKKTKMAENVQTLVAQKKEMKCDKHFRSN